MVDTPAAEPQGGDLEAGVGRLDAGAGAGIKRSPNFACDDADVSELTPLRRNHDFLLLQAGQLFSSFGSNMSRIAYPLLALAVTHSAAAAGYVSAMVFVPMLAFNLVAGVAADRF